MLVSPRSVMNLNTLNVPVRNSRVIRTIIGTVMSSYCETLRKRYITSAPTSMQYASKCTRTENDYLSLPVPLCE